MIPNLIQLRGEKEFEGRKINQGTMTHVIRAVFEGIGFWGNLLKILKEFVKILLVTHGLGYLVLQSNPPNYYKGL